MFHDIRTINSLYKQDQDFIKRIFAHRKSIKPILDNMRNHIHIFKHGQLSFKNKRIYFTNKIVYNYSIVKQIFNDHDLYVYVTNFKSKFLTKKMKKLIHAVYPNDKYSDIPDEDVNVNISTTDDIIQKHVCIQDSKILEYKSTTEQCAQWTKFQEEKEKAEQYNYECRLQKYKEWKESQYEPVTDEGLDEIIQSIIDEEQLEQNAK